LQLQLKYRNSLMSLTTTIKTIQDIMRKDAGVDGDARRVGQLGWLLLLKIFDDQEQEFELTHDDYHSPLPARLRWSAWAADPEGITGDDLLDFVNNDLFPALKRQTQAHRGYAGRASWASCSTSSVC
jgi:type I restriction enzyme M protein